MKKGGSAVSITIKIGEVLATVHNGEWVTDEKVLIPRVLEMLETQTEMDTLMRRYGTTDTPDFDMSCATHMAEKFKGKIVDKSKHIPPTTDDVNVLF